LDAIIKIILVILVSIISVLCSVMSFSEEKPLEYLGLPSMLGRPTQSSVTLNLVAGERAVSCYAEFGKVRGTTVKDWSRTGTVKLAAGSVNEITIQNLQPDSLYNYRLYGSFEDSSDYKIVTEKFFRTQRSAPAPFSFAIISDSHLTPFNRDRLDVLTRIIDTLLKKRPEFMFLLGDNIQTFSSHGGPMTEERFGPLLYSILRKGLGELPESVPVFTANGNWEGENGWHPEKERGLARESRMTFIPNPSESTYPEGGGRDEDYFGFTWGDVLFLVLNVTGYTPDDHALGSYVGKHDDWTLGDKQKSWLHEQLSGSKARWKLLFMHHTVGGNAGDDMNSRYGRGGGRAANTGEQALIHDWMRKFGVNALFYGHDHVFTDAVVDGIHYVCVGSAGAPWKFTKAETGYDKFWPSSGYTYVEVENDSLKVSFIRPDVQIGEGVVMHSFEMPNKKLN
jgi:predicted phosphodiesterase